MLPTKLLILFSAFVFVSGQGFTYYGTSNVRNQSRPPPHPLTLQSTSYQSKPDNVPRPVYVPPPPVAPGSTTTANPVPVYAVSSNQYQPSPAPLQPAVQSAPLSPQPISSPSNLWSSGMYSRPTQVLGPTRPLPPLPPPTPATIAPAPSTPEPESTVIITESPSISVNNLYPQSINSEPSPPESITTIRDTLPFEGNGIPNQSGIAVSSTAITPVPEIIMVVEPEKTPKPVPIETINPSSPYPEMPPSNQPTSRQHIIPVSHGSNYIPATHTNHISPGSNYIQTTLRPPPIFPPLNPPSRNPPIPDQPQPLTYPLYSSPSAEPEISTLPPPQPSPISISFTPSEEETLFEPSSPTPDTRPSIISSSDTETFSESDNANKPIELPEPSPAPLPPPEEPIVPPAEPASPSPEPLYPTPEPPAPSTESPTPNPEPIYPPKITVPPVPEPLYPPQEPIVPPIQRPGPSPIPSYPTPEPPTPSTQPPAPKPIPTLKPAPIYHPQEPVVPPVQPPIPNPPTNPTNRPPAFVSKPLESKLLVGFTCTRGNGYYAIAEQCDSYVECQANQAWQIYCPDGLHFNPNAAYPDYPCAYPSEVKCTGSAAKQVAQPTSECPRRYGFFPTPDGDCSKYVNCQEGKATLMNCPYGLVFNDALSSCDWPENVPQCNLQAFKDFTCPAPPLDSDGNPTDIIYKYKYGSHCKMYLACQRGHPRLLRCDSGMSFDEKSQACIDSDFVPECSMRT